MIDFEWIASRLWASVVAILMGAFFFFFSPQASAATFHKCTPNPQAWIVIN